MDVTSDNDPDVAVTEEWVVRDGRSVFFGHVTVDGVRMYSEIIRGKNVRFGSDDYSIEERLDGVYRHWLDTLPDE